MSHVISPDRRRPCSSSLFNPNTPTFGGCSQNLIGPNTHITISLNQTKVKNYIDPATPGYIEWITPYALPNQVNRSRMFALFSLS
jgi:hypothetical protein